MFTSFGSKVTVIEMLAAPAAARGRGGVEGAPEGLPQAGIDVQDRHQAGRRRDGPTTASPVVRGEGRDAGGRDPARRRRPRAVHRGPGARERGPRDRPRLPRGRWLPAHRRRARLRDRRRGHRGALAGPQGLGRGDRRRRAHGRATRPGRSTTSGCRRWCSPSPEVAASASPRRRRARPATTWRSASSPSPPRQGEDRGQERPASSRWCATPSTTRCSASTSSAPTPPT
jgi:hypothetical protein